MNVFLIFIGKLILLFSKVSNLGSGSTWPGHIALSVNKNFIKDVLDNSKTKVMYVAGTNGKTTTGKLIQTILHHNGNKVFHNAAGANLLNGIASALIRNASLTGSLNQDFAVIEIDENTLPLAINAYKPDYLILLNLFRDQLDRYGEVNTIALKWKDAIKQLRNETVLVLNADDPQIAHLGIGQKNTYYFGLNDAKLAQKEHQHASDSTYCPKCHTKLDYKRVYYSHVGEWQCPKCKLERPKLDLSDSPIYALDGIYNKYNTLAAVLSAKIILGESAQISSALQNFKPAFGRQEIIEYKRKKVQLFLSKNPTSLNESLRTIKSLGGKHALFVLNDRIPDGRDVSWIWDTDLKESVHESESITVSGDRAYDMGLRIKYADSSTIQNAKLKVQNYNSKLKIIENLPEAIQEATEQLNKNDILYVFPTYSAMLEVRKILTGRKIL